MKKKLLFGIVLLTLFVCVLALLVRGHPMPILQPQGLVAEKQRNLILFTIGLSLLVVIPVYAMTILFVFRYRENNKKANYNPDWDGNKYIEAVWWIIPFTLILILSVVTWRSSHELDPFKALASNEQPETIQVIALQWKWLFIYPKEGIATLNYVQFPEKKPVKFEITSDAPMNSFWIPVLGGQIYAMSGMSTELNLMARGVGVYDGSSANISGEGFSDMRFKAESSTQANFTQWVNKVQQDFRYLSDTEYAALSQPSRNHDVQTYSAVTKGLYDRVVMKYAHSEDQTQTQKENH